jgi:Asp-tRNA(Asn)/Glu-tRNA(Gln) amidotransferase A subunit family amidase
MITRRAILQLVPLCGISSTVFARALAREAEGADELTAEMLGAAKWVSGIELTSEQEQALLQDVKQLQPLLSNLRKFPLSAQADLPALHFSTLNSAAAYPPGGLSAAPSESLPRGSWPVEIPSLRRPDSDQELAFSSISQLSALIRSRKISSVELTEIYLQRLKKYDPLLKCVVHLTEELAMHQARRADQELARGRYRSMLHGIPWGAKDLISVPGYPTTWGIPVYRERVIDETATVAARLQEAGSVLVAKLSLGAIAMGDRWYQGMTRNPWNPRLGSSGSSAGSAAATSAGLVGFAIGSETLGSILSPSTRCGTHGLRPTFGRVSRAGCMPLSWSMDKLGPMARRVEDLGTVLATIYGVDPGDPTTVSRPFRWPSQSRINFRSLRIGVSDEQSDDESLQVMRELGCQIRQVQLPSGFPLRSLTKIIDIEGACIFDDLLRQGETEGWNAWTKIFQTAQYITAIDYLRMQRVRRRLMQEFEQAISQVDVLWNMSDLLHTNLTGHPSLIFPYKIDRVGRQNVPKMVTITGHLFDEERLLAIGKAFEDRWNQPLPAPPLEDFLQDWQQRNHNGSEDPPDSSAPD